MPEPTTARSQPDVGRFVSDAWRARYFAACDAVYALGAPASWEEDVETSFGTTHVYRYDPEDPAARERTPLVLVHGAGSCSAMWYPNTPALGTDRPVYAIDTLGDPGRSVQREPIHHPAPGRANTATPSAPSSVPMCRTAPSPTGALPLSPSRQRKRGLAAGTSIRCTSTWVIFILAFVFCKKDVGSEAGVLRSRRTPGARRCCRRSSSNR